MDSVTLMVSALVAGSSNVATPAIQGVYDDLKDLIGRKLAGQVGVQAAIASLESKPDSQARQSVLAEELQAAGAAQDPELAALAQRLLDLVRRAEGGGARYTAALHGSGAIAQGMGAVAASGGGVAVHGNVHGSIVTGSRNVVGASADSTQPATSAAITPEAKIASLQTQLDNRRRKLADLERQRVTALGNEAATLNVLILQENEAIGELEKQMDALKSR